MRKILPWIIPLLLILCVLAFCFSEGETVEWSDIRLGHILPKPQSKRMTIVWNDEDRLVVYVHNTTQNEYFEYQRECEEDKQFAIDVEMIGMLFNAYNQQGYSLSLYYDEDEDEMHITLDVPIPMEKVELPAFATSVGLPTPTSNIGHYNWQGDGSFFLYVGETSKESYLLYKEACKEAGFVADLYEYDVVYSAKNNSGHKVSLNYIGFNIFTIEFDSQENQTSSNDTTEYTPDYSDARSFESALNNGENVDGKIVQFVVENYYPDSILGINCAAGEHLNFISESELDVQSGDVIIGRVIEEPSKILLSWEIQFEVLKIENGNSEDDQIQPPLKENEAKMPASSIDLKYDNYKDVEIVLKEAGFKNVKMKIIYDIIWGWTEEGEVESVSVSGTKSFDKGDIFEKDVEIIITYHMKYADDPNRPTVTLPTEPNNNPVSYSTNTRATVKNGNSGVYSYKSNGGVYDIYWIIDFDEGYVYWFTEGNGNEHCDRLKMQSGDLNTSLKITYHDDGVMWSYLLYFKYKNQPDILVMCDNDGFTREYSPTNLSDALALRKTKTIISY